MFICLCLPLAVAIYVYMFMFTTCSRNICRLLKPPQLRFKYLRDNTINRAKCFIISRLSRQRKFIGKQFLFSRFTTHQCSVDNFYAAQKFTFLAAALYVRVRYCSYTLHTRVWLFTWSQGHPLQLHFCSRSIRGAFDCNPYNWRCRRSFNKWNSNVWWHQIQCYLQFFKYVDFSQWSVPTPKRFDWFHLGQNPAMRRSEDDSPGVPSVQMSYKYTNAQIHKYTNTQIHIYTYTQIHKYTNIQIHK